jgi:rhodanese-related sulfurtransferase
MSNFISHEEEFIILTEEGKELDIINRFFRIGYFNIRGYNKFNVDDLDADFVKPAILTFDTLSDVKDRYHLDVRSKPEWNNTGVLEGAKCISLPELEGRREEVKDQKNIVINCMGGLRARVAFSLLARHNIEAMVFVEEVANYKPRGLKMVDFTE